MKKILLTMIAALMALGFSGCSGQAPDEVITSIYEAYTTGDAKKVKSLTTQSRYNRIIKVLKRACKETKASGATGIEFDTKCMAESGKLLGYIKSSRVIKATDTDAQVELSLALKGSEDVVENTVKLTKSESGWLLK